MATTFTSQAKLQLPGTGDRGWDVPLLANINSLDGYNAIGALCVTPKEIPSASLNVSVAAGSFPAPGGVIASYAGIATQALGASLTSYLYLTVSGTTGTLVVNTTGFPASTSHVRLAVVVTGPSTVTSITDARLPYRTAGALVDLPLTGGTFADTSATVILHTGTTNGTKVGGTASELLSLWGVGPVVQPSGASQAAMGALTTSVLTVSTGGVASAVLAAATNTSALTDSSTGTASTTIGDVGAAFSQSALNNIHASFAARWAEQRALNIVLINAVTSIGTQLNAARVDVGAAQTLLNALRSAGVSLGAWKGSS